MAEKIAFVTGSEGFLGSHVVDALKGAGWRVAGLGNAPRYPIRAGLRGSDARFIGAIDRELLSTASEKMGPPALVVHCAGGASVGASLVDPHRDFRRTVTATADVLEYMRQSSPGARLVYVSSAAVYGAGYGRGIRETDALQPISPYGAHKALAEQLALRWADLFGLDVRIVRFFSIYGEGLRKQLLWDLCGRILGGESPLRLAGTGGERRDFIHVTDAAALVRILGETAKGDFSVVNGGLGGTVEVREVVETLCAALGSNCQVEFSGVSREGDPRILVADAGRATQLGFTPGISLRDGIQRFADWARREVTNQAAG